MAPGNEGEEFSTIDADRLLGRDDALSHVVRNGMRWRILHESVDSIAGLIDFAQRALNVDAREGVSELEMITRLSPCLV